MAPARPHRRIRMTTALICNLPHREPLCAPASLGIESKLIRVAGCVSILVNTDLAQGRTRTFVPSSISVGLRGDRSSNKLDHDRGSVTTAAFRQARPDGHSTGGSDPASLPPACL